VAICEGGRPEIAIGTSTSTPSVPSSGSCTSNTWVTSQPPSQIITTRKCGAPLAAMASRLSGQGVASVAAVATPSCSSVRLVTPSLHIVRIVPSC
jgi:hypothetical protein